MIKEKQRRKKLRVDDRVDSVSALLDVRQRSIIWKRKLTHEDTLREKKRVSLFLENIKKKN